MSMQNNLYRMVHGILAREGMTASLTQLGVGGVYDPATSSYTPSASVVTPIRVALLDYSNIANGLTTHGNTLVESGDKQAYADGHSLTTKISPTGDTITIGTEVWRIMSVREYNVTTTFSILYDLLLRK